MFENMSPREKKLVLIVGSMLPIVVLFLVSMWFFDRLDSNDAEIAALTDQIETQEKLQKDGVRASQREHYYRKISLPSELNWARSVYRPWLDDLVLKECGMSHNGVKPKSNVGSIKHERDTIAERLVFTVRPKGTLQQLVQFLHAFYSAEHLHRINKLSIKPEVLTKRGNKVLTGMLNLDIEVETLSMAGSSEKLDTFPVWSRELKPLDDYSDLILARNIFGPANNTPSFDKPKKLEFVHAKEGDDVAGKYVTIQLTAKDADKDDILGFELVEQSGDEKNVAVVLGEQPRAANVRKISLRVPMQSKPMRIPISLRVFDDGLPAKEDLMDFKVVFKAPEKKVEDTPEPDPEPIDFAKHTYVRGLTRVEGKWYAFLVEQLKSQKMIKLGVGDSIEVGEQDWKVVSIDANTVTFEVEGKRRSFKTDTNLAEPMKAL